MFAQSQESEFADDFSTDSISFSTRSFDGVTGGSEAIGVDGAIQLSASSDGTGFANRWLPIADVTDSLSVTARLTSESIITTTPNGHSSALLRVEGTFYNDLGLQSEDNEGDVFGNIEMRLNADGIITFNGCVARDAGAAEEPLNLFDNGTDSCFNLFDKTGLPDTDYNMGFRVDRGNSTLTFFVDEASVVADISTPVFSAIQSRTAVQVIQQQGNGLVVGQISAVTTDANNIELTGTTPILDRYRPTTDYNDDNRSLSLSNGHVTITANSDNPDDGSSAELWLQSNGDYIESTMAISSESTFPEARSQVDSILKLVAFNDTADNGFDGQTGDVEARIMLTASGNGQRRAQYCLFRSDDADFNNATGLLNEENCRDFRHNLELDRDYRSSIEVDRIASMVTFRLDGYQQEVEVLSGIFQTASGRRYIGARASGIATAVVNVDDVRTSADTLTNTEIADAQTQAPSFPEALDPSVSAVDSTLTATQPFNNTLDFVDDFSSDSTLFGFWGGRSRGESAVGYQDGALVLQANTATEFVEDGNYSEFYFGGGESDSIAATLSLSSNTQLPPGDSSRASVQIRLRAFNDTQDGGFNEEEGDIEATLSIVLRGVGRFEIEPEIRRRRAEGGSDKIVRLGNLPAFSEIINLVPSLDTLYDMSITLDRQRGVMTYQVDHIVAEYALETGIFIPYRASQVLQASHRGTSGRVVANVYNVTTDNFSQDFTNGAPSLPPYAAGFDANYSGIEVSVEQERLRLTADSSLSPDRFPRMRVLGTSDYIGASIELSSQSVLSNGGDVSVRIGATLYNDLYGNAESTNGNEGDIFTRISISHALAADGQLKATASYCAFRSNSADFSDSIELIGGDNDTCPTFTIVPELDTAYDASIELNRDTSQLIFSFADEVRVYDIGTAIYDAASPYRDVWAAASMGSKVIAYADDLTVSADPVPLALSNSLLTLQPDDSNTPDDNNPVATPDTQPQRRVCASELSDPDGDGWGWEDKLSCVVVGSQAQQAAMLMIPPFCTSNAVAIDATGWGWENSATCIEQGSKADSLINR